VHGLINRSIQCFLCDTYGRATWGEIVAAADLGVENFEAMLSYDNVQTEAVLNAASDCLAKPRDMVLEDLGTYLVSHPNQRRLRRLLRFGGESFVDFLHSLDELPDRARLAVPDLTMPQLELNAHVAGTFTLAVTHEHPGFGNVMVGVLRAMADDYGSLALLEFQGRRGCAETIKIELLDVGFAQGRHFELGVPAK